ncbi:DNA polymerase III subunit gamma and tau [Haloglycomyces albus]|uniref:DNA polymerase III subunit gamma and tau n=1 Tax=Haloglycomyces albus TaxID=526067 RepID=UPI00046D124E|nr:DNA polymerase III subunit gamma and tau [Haloglycomyces albus]
MALALYRKYRPQSFAEVVGQEHVTEPLMNALANGRLNHAFLFSGPRGCGKTSSARILARSLNCAEGPTVNPCGSCYSCQALSAGGPGSVDVIEIDAASHGGVEDARELRERAVFAPVESRYKIYIIDEAHMVTAAGFNALLKLVEEPPEYVVFIFATTEPEKVLPTIRSRTHHYPFRLIPPPTMKELCQRLCSEEDITVADDAFPLVVRAGGGSARDTLSILDQLIAGAGPEGVTHAMTAELLGVSDATLLDDMCEAFANSDGATVMSVVERVVDAGLDARRFAQDLLERLRDLIVLTQVPDAGDKSLVDAPADQLTRMKSQATRLGLASLTRMAEVIADGISTMKGATAPRLLLEIACARAVLPGSEDTMASLLQRIEAVETRGPAAAATPQPTAEPPKPAPAPTPAAPPPATEATSTPAPEPTPETPPQKPATPAAEPTVPPVETTPAPSADVASVRRQWDRIMQAVRSQKRVTAFQLKEAVVTDVSDHEVLLTFDNPFLAKTVQEDPAYSIVTQALTQILGGRWRLRCKVGSGTNPPPPPPPPADTDMPAASGDAPPAEPPWEAAQVTPPPPEANIASEPPPAKSGSGTVPRSQTGGGTSGPSAGGAPVETAVHMLTEAFDARKIK